MNRTLADIRRDIAEHFAAQVAWRNCGVLAAPPRCNALPREVAGIAGSVDDPVILVTLQDGRVLKYWAGRRGEYRYLLGYPLLTPKYAGHSRPQR